MVSAQFRYISDDPLGDRSVRGLVVELKLVVVPALFRFVGVTTRSVVACVRVDCGLVVTLSASFRFVGLVVTPKVITRTVDAAGVSHDAKTRSFGTISNRRACRDAKSDDPYSGRSWGVP